MKIPCAFEWYECVCDEARAKHRCELQDAILPYWARVYLAGACPFRGERLIASDEFSQSDWRWKGGKQWH